MYVFLILFSFTKLECTTIYIVYNRYRLNTLLSHSNNVLKIKLFLISNLDVKQSLIKRRKCFCGVNWVYKLAKLLY